MPNKYDNPKIESGMTMQEEMIAIGLDPNNKTDVKYFKVLYTIWAEEKSKILSSSNKYSEAQLNDKIGQATSLRLMGLRHNATIN